ncbi:MAG: HAMP domain-containing sensor histidine kinase [Chloroflexi bacterium]|nr:HAMP domain-containing sensor histidine kinase [Chloroflexota bacterium]
MSLLVQFLIVSILPLCFVGMAVYVVRVQPVAKRIGVWWVLGLLAMAAWSSHLLSVYLGINFNPWVAYNWRALGRYSLTLTGTFTLLTTLAFIRQTRPRLGWLPLGGVVLWLAAIALDPAIWAYRLPAINLAGRTIYHFDWWGILWVSSWVVPTALAWFQIERANRTVPKSLFRNQVGFWFLTTTLFLIGGALALVRDSITLQQIGAVGLVLATFIGTFSITRTYLPDVGNVLRQFLLVAVRSLLLFIVIWAGMVLLIRYVVNTPSQNSILVLSAALFAITLLLLLALTEGFSKRVVAPAQAAESEALELQLDLGSSLLAPRELVDLFVQWLHTNIPHEQSWVMEAADGPGGRLLLQPLSSHAPTEAASLAADSPFVAYLRHNPHPLTQEDIDSLTLFSQLEAAERDLITQWQGTLFMPIHASQRLVALLALGHKSNESPYDKRDFQLLREQAAKFGPLLVQSQALHAMQAANLHTLRHNRDLAQENRRLVELIALHRQFTALMSPTIRKPFNDLELQLVKLHSQPEAAAVNSSLAPLQESAGEARALVDNLITVAGRLEKQTTFTLAPVHLDSVVRTAMKSLLPMAEARHNKMELEVRGKLLPVLGDEQRLVEGFQQLLHNALKYNKLNHYVQIICEMRHHEARVQIIDFGVGIPPNRLDEIWEGLTKLEGETAAKRRRTRLGLALARFIIQSHGGRIEVRSSHGSGSTFTVSLPALVEEV